MKTCPQCGTQYSDDTLRFCLQDGSPLGSDASGTPTAVLGEKETAAARDAARRVNIPIGDPAPSNWPPSQATQIAAPATTKKGPNTLMAVLLTAVGMLILFAVVGVGALIYFKGGPQIPAGNFVDNSKQTDDNGKVKKSEISTPSTSPTPKPSGPANTPVTQPPIDDAQISSEVRDRINSWKSQSEALNVNAYIAHYAPVVDYYSKPGVSRAYVRADKMRAFSRYSSIRVDISNMTVTGRPIG